MSADLLTLSEVAVRLGRSQWFVQGLVRDGLLVTVGRDGGRRFVTRVSLDAWLASGGPDPAQAAKFYICPEVVKTRGRGA